MFADLIIRQDTIRDLQHPFGIHEYTGSRPGQPARDQKTSTGARFGN